MKLLQFSKKKKLLLTAISVSAVLLSTAVISCETKTKSTKVTETDKTKDKTPDKKPIIDNKPLNPNKPVKPLTPENPDLKPPTNPSTPPKNPDHKPPTTPPTPPKNPDLKPPTNPPTPPINPTNPPITPTNPKPETPSNPPTIPKFDPNNPVFPGGFPNFPSRYVPLSSSNLKPTTDNYFKNTSFKKPNEEELYREIYDRSFAVSFRSRDVWNEVDAKPLEPEKGSDQIPETYTTVSGTSWLFDYAANSDKSKVSLFLATNLHVAANASNTWGHGSDIGKNKTRLFDYTDPTGNYLALISLGKPQIDPKTFGPLPNSTPNFKNVDGEAGTLKYFTNLDLTHAGIYDAGHKVNSMISAPKLIFAGFDFMDNSEYSQFDDRVKNQTEAYLNNKESKNNVNQYYWVKEFYEKHKKLPQLYKDFAIVQVDVDFTKDATAEDEQFKKYVLKAMAAFDKSIERVKNNIVPNNDGSIPYITYDYASIQKNPDIEKHKNLKNYDYSQQYVDNVLIGGFPGDSNSIQWWGRNNPTERYSNFPNKTLGHTNISATLDGGIGVVRLFINRPLIENYGFKYGNLPYSSLSPGSSGSLGFSDYGIPIGIHSDFSLSVKNPYDLSRSGSLTTFVQSSDIPVFEGGVIHAYNMIDGSNKALYPHQKTSYRENLDLLYGNEGIGPFKLKGTAMFPNGYKIDKNN